MPDRDPLFPADQADAIRAEDLRRMYERSAIGMFRSTQDGRFIAANPAGARLHGYASEAELLAVVGDIATEIYVNPDDRETMRRLLEEHGSVEGFECEIYRHRTQERCWVRQNVYRVTDDEGRLCCLEGYVEDISDRRRTEQELRQAREELESRVAERTAQLEAINRALEEEVRDRRRAEEQARTRQFWLDAILDNAPIEVVLKDTEGRIMAISRNVMELQGKPEDAYHGTTSADHLPPEIAEIYMAADREVMATGEALQREVREELNGEVRYSLSQKFPMRDAQGVIRGVCSLTTDITGMKEAEARLAQAQKMEAVGQLTGGVAHDFNNLLAAIMGNAELLELGGAEDAGRLAQRILRAARRGAELTQRLLAFSRRQPLRPRIIDLGELAHGMTALIERTLGETIAVETVADKGLWPALADPGQVENALLNLAINARDAMPGGGRLSIECINSGLDAAYIAQNPEAEVGDYVLLSVSDTGTGMAPEVLERVFEPFFTTKEVGKGSGLGLSMVYGFAKQSGGHVIVYSEPGQGTSVKLYLPRAVTPTRPQPGLEEAEGQAALVAPPGNGETVLLVEDDEEVREMAEAMLEDLGYRVIGAHDAARALEALGKQDDARVDLMLTDIVLPGGMSGPELAGRAKARRPGLTVIYMSGYPAAALRQKGVLAPDTVLLDKPFRRQQLAEALHTALAPKAD